MSPRKQLKGSSKAPRARRSRSRQRQRLIDASISALHIYGPSRTTVEKVVAIAKMSPGIVRFYFDSKAAMLVASLQFLASEFEEQLLVPVSKLKSTPVAALELLVDLYLDPEIASPRKVSVWYAFWGEASSRQEYYDICGQKDESFAALVRELIGALIIETAQPHLDPDGVALGLIGVLEILWQDFAFRTEREIDRPAAKRRCRAYLRSVFPGQFAASDGRASGDARSPTSRSQLAAWTYANPRLHSMERNRLFQSAWVVAAHESQIPGSGDFLTVDTGIERVLVLRDGEVVRVLRNSCPESPHMLVTQRSGRLDAEIECKLHGLKFSLGGRRVGGASSADLGVLPLSSAAGLLLVRSSSVSETATEEPWRADWLGEPTPALKALGGASEWVVAADWKVIVEQWLGTVPRAAPPEPGALRDVLEWSTPPGEASWSARRYASIVAGAHLPWRRLFVAPHQLLERRPDGVSVIQALPLGPGRSLVRRLDCTSVAADARARAAGYLARRLSPFASRTLRQVAESTQNGIVEFGYEVSSASSPAVAWLRERLRQQIPALALPGPFGEATSL